MSRDSGLTCDHCEEPMRVDTNGFYVGPDGTSDCEADEGGHTVDGRVRFT